LRGENHILNTSCQGGRICAGGKVSGKRLAGETGQGIQLTLKYGGGKKKKGSASVNLPRLFRETERGTEKKKRVLKDIFHRNGTR